MDRETAHWRSALPPRRRDRWLLAAGASALIAGLPALWTWVLYASGFGASLVRVCAVALALTAAVVGLAMLRLLDRR